jgi:hypothetical protein
MSWLTGHHPELSHFIQKLECRTKFCNITAVD